MNRNIGYTLFFAVTVLFEGMALNHAIHQRMDTVVALLLIIAVLFVILQIKERDWGEMAIHLLGIALVAYSANVIESPRTQTDFAHQSAEPTLAIPPAGPLPTEIVQMCIQDFYSDIVQTTGGPYLVGVLELGTGNKYFLIGVDEDITPEEITEVSTHYETEPKVLRQGHYFGITGIDIQYVRGLFLVDGPFCQ